MNFHCFLCFHKARPKDTVRNKAKNHLALIISIRVSKNVPCQRDWKNCTIDNSINKICNNKIVITLMSSFFEGGEPRQWWRILFFKSPVHPRTPPPLQRGTTSKIFRSFYTTLTSSFSRSGYSPARISSLVFQAYPVCSSLRRSGEISSHFAI